MRRRPRLLFSVLLCAAPAVSACGRRTAVDGYPDAGEGRLAAQAGGRLMLHGAAQATYCRGDSILVVVAVTSRWTAGLALRGAFPVAAVHEYAIGGALADTGSATAAFRSVTDSVEPALLGAGGTVHLAPGRRATGRFAVDVPAPDGRSPARRILGTFRSLPTADTAATCSSTPRTP
jgi:hypothetical protein